MHGACARKPLMPATDIRPPPILPDILPPGLALVFCGMAAGSASARRGAYYAGPGNRFWTMLARTSLTPRLLAPAEFASLPSWGIGLTDLAKSASGADSVIPAAAIDRAGLAARIMAARPSQLAFNGKRAAALFLGVTTLPYGAVAGPPGMPPIFVLPSTSGAANGFWDERPWFALAELVRAELVRPGSRSDSVPG
jgi:TDG/mug DNA glycosylase family protein